MYLSFGNYCILLILLFIVIFLTLVQNSVLMGELEKKFSEIKISIYRLAPESFKTASNKKLTLKIWVLKSLLWKSILLGVTIIILYNLSMIILFWKNRQLYDTLNFYITSLYTYFFFFQMAFQSKIILFI